MNEIARYIATPINSFFQLIQLKLTAFKPQVISVAGRKKRIIIALSPPKVQAVSMLTEFITEKQITTVTTCKRVITANHLFQGFFGLWYISGVYQAFDK
jgi:hypothetical protein